MNSESGVTLIELLVICAVLGILAAIAIPGYMSMLPGLRLNGASRMLMGDLMGARMSSIKENNSYKIFFLNDHQYRILDDDDEDGSIDSGDSYTTRNIQAEYADVTFNATANPTFHPKGTASGATIVLQNSSGSKTLSISLAGRVKLE